MMSLTVHNSNTQGFVGVVNRRARVQEREESAVGRGVLNQHQCGIVRGDAVSVFEDLGFVECPSWTAEALAPDVP